MKTHLLQTRKAGGTCLFLCLMLLLTGSVWAQGITVRGKVTDQAGAAIPGTNVVIKGSTSGTVTDADGAFTLSVPNQDAVLVVSYLGYQAQELPVGTQTNFSISLAEDVTALEELVVVGYGSQKKSDLTGAISSIPTDEIASFPIARVDQAIQGRTPGVYVLNTDGAPGRKYYDSYQG